MPGRTRKSSFNRMASLNISHASEGANKNVGCQICHKPLNWSNTSKSCNSCNMYFCSECAQKNFNQREDTCCSIF